MIHPAKTLLLSVCAVILCACSGEEPAGADYSERRAAPVENLSDADIADMSITDMADTLIDGGQEVRDLLATVDSEAAARAALPELERMAESYGRVLSRFENIDEPSFADITALAARAPRVMNAQMGVFAEVERINENHPEAREVLREALEDFGQSDDE